MKITTQIISDKVVVITPETEEFIEHAIVINKVQDGISINQAGDSIYIPHWALKEVCKQANRLNDIK